MTSYLTIHGSHAYGLATSESDVDKRGFFFSSPENFWGLHKGPETKLGPGDTVVWEFRKFMGLACQSNPNILELLFTEDSDVEIGSVVSTELRANSDWFLSKKLEKTFGGYARQQLLKLSKRLDSWEDAGLRKDAMHTARLFVVANKVLKTGKLQVKFDSEHDADKVNLFMGIRRGQVRPILLHEWCLRQEEELTKNAAQCVLPEEPKLDLIDAWVQKTLRRMYACDLTV